MAAAGRLTAQPRTVGSSGGGLFARSPLAAVLALDAAAALWHALRRGTAPLLLHFVERPERASTAHILAADALLTLLHAAFCARAPLLRVRAAV